MLLHIARGKNEICKNKTIDISLTDGQEYLQRCISVSRKTEVKNILNKTIIGDSLKVMEKFPRSFVDLLIVDPLII